MRALFVNLIALALSDSVVIIAGTWKLDRTLDGKTPLPDRCE
jgi:hypothetical protein